MVKADGQSHVAECPEDKEEEKPEETKEDLSNTSSVSLQDSSSSSSGNQLMTEAPSSLAISLPEASGGLPQQPVKSSDQKLLELTNKTLYSLVQRNGQRIYGGPPPGWQGPAPEKGCEVFVGKVPRDCYEDELVPIFEAVSRIK